MSGVCGKARDIRQKSLQWPVIRIWAGSRRTRRPRRDYRIIRESGTWRTRLCAVRRGTDSNRPSHPTSPHLPAIETPHKRQLRLQTGRGRTSLPSLPNTVVNTVENCPPLIHSQLPTNAIDTLHPHPRGPPWRLHLEYHTSAKSPWIVLLRVTGTTAVPTTETLRPRRMLKVYVALPPPYA